MIAVDNRPTVSYRGDVTGDVGRIVGPTLAGEYLVLDQADHDPASDMTMARFRYATPADFEGTQPPLPAPAGATLR